MAILPVLGKSRNGRMIFGVFRSGGLDDIGRLPSCLLSVVMMIHFLEEEEEEEEEELQH